MIVVRVVEHGDVSVGLRHAGQIELHAPNACGDAFGHSDTIVVRDLQRRLETTHGHCVVVGCQFLLRTIGRHLQIDLSLQTLETDLEPLR